MLIIMSCYCKKKFVWNQNMNHPGSSVEAVDFKWIKPIISGCRLCNYYYYYKKIQFKDDFRKWFQLWMLLYVQTDKHGTYSFSTFIMKIKPYDCCSKHLCDLDQSTGQPAHASRLRSMCTICDVLAVHCGVNKITCVSCKASNTYGHWWAEV